MNTDNTDMITVVDNITIWPTAKQPMCIIPYLNAGKNTEQKGKIEWME